MFRKEWRFESSSGHHQPAKWLISGKLAILKGFLPTLFTQAFTQDAFFGDEDMAIPKHLILIRDTYYANVRVPSGIAESYGKTNVRRSLETKDEKEAGRRVHAKVAEIEREFADHRTKLQALVPAADAPKAVPTPQSFADLGRQYGREIAEQALTVRADLYEKAVGDSKKFWRDARQEFSDADGFTYFDKLTADGDLDRVVSYVVRRLTERRVADLKRMLDTGDMAELLALAEQRSPGLDKKPVIALAMTLARSEITALQASLSGDHVHVQEHLRPLAIIPESAATAAALPPVSLDDLFDKWKAEIKPSASTLSTWGGHIRALKKAFPEKAQDAGSLTPEDMIKWKDEMVAAGKSAKTINDSYFAAVRTVFTYGVNNRLIASNPGIGVKTAGGKKAGTGKLPYTNDEVARLLELAKKETNPAKRWLPWLAAQTGSRIGEVAQLQGSYVKVEDGIHYLDIKPAPDAGSIKEEVSERTVPLHPQLIADGFLEFVKSKGDGPLFYNRSSGDPTKKHASKGVTNHLGAWIRENGFTDPRKAPSHGLRHWFKTEASRVGIDSRDVDKLQGHAPRSEADKYYHPDLAMKLAALEKLNLPPVKRHGYASKGEGGSKD